MNGESQGGCRECPLPVGGAAGRDQDQSGEPPARIARRTLLVGGSLAAAGLVACPFVQRLMRRSASVFIARDQRYDQRLVRTIRDGLLAVGLQRGALRGRKVLLKPNLVEPSAHARHRTTHPAVIAAAIEVFRSWDAQVTVGEGPGHVRDTELALAESGVQDVLDDLQAPFADLNYDDVAWVENQGGQSGLEGFHLPRAVIEADLVVSLPKLKTHHWAGMTSAMKNLYGVLPGVKYGWPKNVLHHAGIHETVFDINASLRKTIAIVDAIDCMEGDGPIMGSRKQAGLILVGTNVTAVDATAARLMELDPRRIYYLWLATNRLGPTTESLIRQRGEAWQPLAQPFALLDVPHLRGLR